MEDEIYNFDLNKKQEKKEPIKLQDKYLYNNYFQSTAKLWKEYDSEIKLFEEINSGRIFFKNEKPSYFEIYKEPRLEIMGISENISVLYAPSEEDKNKYDEKRCIGFRYYEKNNKEKCNYFTLIKRYDNRFFILEKEKEKQIFDIKGEPFYKEDLNCYSIIQKIVFEKYKNEIVSPRGEIFPEIIGFAYSMVSLQKFKNFIVIEPLILEPLNEESKIEKLPDVLEPDIGYIEPILFDNHISVAVIKQSQAQKTGRFNIILDMSRYHIEDNLLDNTVFPEAIYQNHYAYPPFSIQKGNSCGLWFYGIVECIYSNNDYKNIRDVCLAIRRNNTKFFMDVINCLSSKLYNIPDIIDNSSIVEENINIKENRYYHSGQLSSHSFRKEAVMSYFFSLASLFAYYENKNDINNNEKIYGLELLLEYQYLIDNIRNYLSLVIFNNNYFAKYSPKIIYNEKQKIEYQKLIAKLRDLLNMVSSNYENAFYNSLSNLFEFYINYSKMIDKKKLKDALKKLTQLVTTIYDINPQTINKLKQEFSDIKYSKKVVVIKEEASITKYLNPNNDFNLQMMIH